MADLFNYSSPDHNSADFLSQIMSVLEGGPSTQVMEPVGSASELMPAEFAEMEGDDGYGEASGYAQAGQSISKGIDKFGQRLKDKQREEAIRKALEGTPGKDRPFTEANQGDLDYIRSTQQQRSPYSAPQAATASPSSGGMGPQPRPLPGGQSAPGELGTPQPTAPTGSSTLKAPVAYNQATTPPVSQPSAIAASQQSAQTQGAMTLASGGRPPLSSLTQSTQIFGGALGGSPGAASSIFASL